MELRQAGIRFQSQHVYSREAFRKALEKETPDLILSDQGLPSFDGFTALQIAQEKCPQVPFIVVSGSYDQEAAVELLMNGAADYVHKAHLGDLVPAVTQALAEAERQKVENLKAPEPPPRLAEDQPFVILQRPAGAGSPSGPSLFLCPKCRQLTDETGALQDLTEYLATHDKAQITSGFCPRCSYHFP
jgi:DNA-binding response OmpR family regulator